MAVSSSFAPVHNSIESLGNSSIDITNYGSTTVWHITNFGNVPIWYNTTAAAGKGSGGANDIILPGHDVFATVGASYLSLYGPGGLAYVSAGN